MKKFLIIGIVSLFILTLFPIKTRAETIDETLILNISSPSVALIDYSSGKTLYAKEANKRMYPASMTKMMSMYLLLECIKNKTNTFEEIVTVSEFAASMGGSQIFLKENEKMSFEDLFTAIAVASANDAVVALAEHTYGSVELFIDKMNKTAKEFNMNDTHFVNTTGFHDENHYTTVNDMGILARKLLLEHKDNLLKYTSIYETYLRKDTDNPFWLVTTNKLLNTYEGMDGLKTGYTSESGYNLTATAKRDNLRFIAIVMGGSSSKSRNADITTLLNYGFNKYKSVTLYKNGETLKEVTFSNAKYSSSQIITNEDINIVIEKNQNLDNVNINIEIFKNVAPISKEDIIGKLKIKGQDGTLIADYNLYVKEDVPKLSFWDHFLHFFKKII